MVTLDLRLLLEQVAARVGVGERLEQALPASAAQITILRSDQLDAAQTALKVLRGLPIVLVALSILLFGAALLLAPDWRRQALRAYGVGLLLAGLAVLVTQSIAGDQLVSALGTDRRRPAGDRRRLDHRHAVAERGGERGDPLRRGHDRRGLARGPGAAGRRRPPGGRAVRPQPRGHVRGPSRWSWG